MIALIQINDDCARIFLENLLRLCGRAVALGAETQLVARAIPDEGRNRTVLRRDERPSRAIKGHQGPSRSIKRSRAIKSHQEPSRAIQIHQEPSSKRHQEPSRANKSHQEPSRANKSHQDSSRAIKIHQEPSRAIKRHQAPYRTPNQCSTTTSVSRFSYTRMSACQIRQYAIIGGNQWSAVEVRDSLALKGTAISGGASMTKPRDETDETHLACLVRGDTRAYDCIGPRVDDDLHLGRTPLEGLGVREAVGVHAIVGDLDRVVLAHLMRHAIRRIQSGTRSGHQRHSATQKRAIKTNTEWQSVAIRGGNQWQSVAITLRVVQSEAISGPQRQSEVAISGNHTPSGPQRQ